MALQVDAWNGRVVTMEMDPVNASRLIGGMWRHTFSMVFLGGMGSQAKNGS